MKKISLLCALTVFLCSCVSSHYVRTEKSPSFNLKTIKRIAVMNFGSDSINMGGAISDAISTDFLSLGFDVVERSQLNAVFQELKLDSSGAIGEKERKEVGKLLNVDALILGSVSGYLGGKSYTVELRMVDVKTGEILLSLSYLNGSPDKLESTLESICHIGDSMEIKIFEKKGSERLRLRLERNQHTEWKKFTKLALIPPLGTNYFGEGEALSGALTTELLGNGVQLVERSGVEKILKEQFNYSTGFYVNPLNTSIAGLKQVSDPVNNISSSTFNPMNISISKQDLDVIGKLTGADALLIGSFSPLFFGDSLFKLNIVNLRIVDVETGRINWSVSYINKSPGPDSIAMSAELLSVALCPAIKTNNPKDYNDALGEAKKRCKDINSLDFPYIMKNKFKDK